MKTFRYLLVLSLILLFGILEAGNPVMLIRCRAIAGANSLTSNNLNACAGCPEGYLFYDPDGFCVPAADDSPNDPDNNGSLIEAQCLLLATTDEEAGFSCGEGFRLDSVLVEVIGVAISFEWIKVCVPDCEGVVCEILDDAQSAIGCDEPEWSIEHQQCGCEIDVTTTVDVDESVSLFDACNCPPGYGQEGVTDGFDPFLPCEILDKDCYDGELVVNVEPFLCDSEGLPEQIIKITITGPSGSPLTSEDALTINSLENCDLITDDNFLQILKEEFGDVNTSFVPDADGKVVIEFKRDPDFATVIDLRSQVITIPKCPTLDASDPCSCNPQNITDTDGTVLFWYDELTIIGTPDSIVKLVSNNNPQGFLMFTPTPAVGATTPFSDNTDFPTALDANGELVIPYFRSADAPTIDILYSYQGGTAETSFSETCDLAPTACASDPIPTLGEWGLMIMSLLLLIIGVVSFQYKGKTLIPIKERVKRK